MPRTIHHRAAGFAVFAIIFAFVVKFVSASIPAPLGPVLSWTADTVGFLAVPAGVVALLGIRKYGTKGLLWKGLVGVLVPTMLLLSGAVIGILLRGSIH